MTFQLPPALLEHTPWETESSPIWLATSIALHRNLSKYCFPPKLNEREYQQVLSAVKEQLLKATLLQSPQAVSAQEVSALDKEFLFEHFLCSQSFQNTLSGQGFAFDGSGHFFAELNIQDHLKMKLIDTQGSWEKAWNQLNQIENALSGAIDFAFSPRFGYLTSDPGLCGTGLVVRAYLHLPALIHTGQLEETLLKQREEGVAAAGMGGTMQELTGDLVVLSNTYTLGVNEESILHSIHSLAMKLMALEKSLRTHLQGAGSPEIKDQVSRAFGLLLHSYQLQTKEALGALSMIKLGLHLDWVEGITDAKLNTLFFQCRRGHLLHAIKEPQVTDLQEIARKRAEFLHKNVQGVKLKYETSL